MPLTDQFLPWHVRNFSGQNTKVRDTLLDDQKGTIARNCRFDYEPGTMTKRQPLAYYNSTSLGSNPVHSLYRFYTVSNKYLLSGYLGTVKVGTDSTGTFSNLSTGLTSDKRQSFVTYKDLCLYSNGYEDIMQTDGSVSWELGSCKAALVTTGAGSVTNGVHYYAVTIDDDAYICGAVSNSVTVDGTHNQVTLSNIPLGPIGTVNRKIYRTSAGGSTLKLLTTIADNTTTTYTDNTADGSLGITMPAVTDDMPKGKYLKVYRERLLITGNVTHPNRVYYSNPYLVHYIQADSNGDYADIQPDDGDVITGLAIQLGTICIIKRNSIRKWHIDNIDDTTWFVEDPISFQGCPAPYTIAETPYGIIYMGWDHIYIFDGAGSKAIIDEFDALNDIETDAINRCVGFWHRNTYLLSYIEASSGTDYPNRVMRYEWLRDAVSVDTINVSSFAAFTGDDESGELYYGDSRLGYVYLAENFPRQVVLNTKTKLNGNLAYPTNIFSGLSEIELAGDEDAPTIEIGRTLTINNAVGTINSGYPGEIIDRAALTGVYTSEPFLINAGAMDKIYWNEVQISGGDILFYTRSGATSAACQAAAWSASLTNPNGSTIESAADVYFQFKAVLTTSDITMTPQITFQDGYTVKFTYTSLGAEVSDDVPFVYCSGKRNFTQPHLDKIYKKIVSLHEGTAGNVTINWETDEGQSGSFVFSLATYPKRWESFFPSTAYGRHITFTISKTDTEEFKQKELMGIYSPMPLII